MAKVGTGTSISFESGFFAEVLDVRPPPASRKKIETSHMLTTVAHTNVPGKLVEWGECEIDLAFDPGQDPPIDNPASAFTIDYPDGESWSGMAWMSRYEPSVPLEDRMTCTAALQVTGDVTIAGASS